MTETQIKQVIVQQEASIDKIEAFLSDEEFREYCDAIAVSITHWRCILKQARDTGIQNVDYEGL